MINEHYVARGAKQDYRTPLDLAQDVRILFGGSIGLDPCCTVNNLRAEVHYTPKEDGLAMPWLDRTWCNPPYEDIYAWFLKCISASNEVHRIGLLTSVARTEQPCTQHLMAHASCIQFLNTKLRHSEGKQAMLASMIFWFNLSSDEVRTKMGDRGIVLVPA